MGAPVVHFEIMGGEGSELETFYRQLFGWKINSNNPMKYGIVETGWNTLEARQSFRLPKYREAPSWPCLPILQAISQDFL
jgi:hypothetical protein